MKLGKHFLPIVIPDNEKSDEDREQMERTIEDEPLTAAPTVFITSVPDTFPTQAKTEMEEKEEEEREKPEDETVPTEAILPVSNTPTLRSSPIQTHLFSSPTKHHVLHSNLTKHHVLHSNLTKHHSLHSSPSTSPIKFRVRQRPRYSEFPPDHIYNPSLKPLVETMKQKEASLLHAWAASHADALTHYIKLNQMMQEKEKLKELEEQKRPTEQPTTSPKNQLSALKMLWMKRSVAQPQESEPASKNEPRDERLEQLFQSQVYVSPNETVCDGCALRSSTKRADSLPNAGIRVWIGDAEQSNFKPKPHPSSHSAPELTMIYVSMMNRLEFIQQILYRWHG